MQKECVCQAFLRTNFVGSTICRVPKTKLYDLKIDNILNLF